jgi:hypothetical protein
MNLQNLKIFINELRTTKREQCYEVGADLSGGRCAIGLIHDINNLDFFRDYDGCFTSEVTHVIGCVETLVGYSPDYTFARDWLGCTVNFTNDNKDYHMFDCIWQMNDKKKSFAEIADYLEAQYPEVKDIVLEEKEEKEEKEGKGISQELQNSLDKILEEMNNVTRNLELEVARV